jgi:hypothetical protein
MIRDLHAFTKAGLSDCMKALDTANGDYFQALCSLLTPDAFREKEQSFRVRSLGDDSILDPVTDEEAKLMDSLRAYFNSLSIRPHHCYFSTEALPRLLFSQPDQFARLVSSMAQSWLSHAWTVCGNDLKEEHRLDPDGLLVSSVALADCRQAAVITMPQTESELEADFIVVCEALKRFRLFGKQYPIRYFLISELMSAPRWNVVVVQECVPKGDDFLIKRHFDRESVKTSPKDLAALVGGIR